MTLDLTQVEGALRVAHDLPHPDWGVIDAAAQRIGLRPDDDGAWLDITRQWLDTLAHALGARYQVSASENAFLVSGARVDNADRLIRFIETVIERIAPLVRNNGEPNMLAVAIVFDEPAPYYSYVAAHDSADGARPSGAGCILGADFPHILVAPTDPYSLRATLAHELTHLMLRARDLPLWLEEGLCEFLPAEFVVESVFVLDRAIAARHRALWSEITLEPFWSGEAWDDADSDVNELCYHLAELFVRKITMEHGPALSAFVRAAAAHDAGQSAAQAQLGRSLEDIAGDFLGPGAWRPAGDYAAREPRNA